jgi:hypothetical protein
VVQVDQDVYSGNAFNANGLSVPGTNSDGQNNTEGVHLAAGTERFTVRVIATNLNSDAILGEGSGTDQDFALVCGNCQAPAAAR